MSKLFAVLIAMTLAGAPKVDAPTLKTPAATEAVYSAQLDAEALAAFHCETCFSGGGSHVFIGEGCAPWDEDCFDCHGGEEPHNFCHVNTSDGSCDLHPKCDEGIGEDVEQALADHDLEVVQHLLIKGRVRVHRGRNALQVTNCEDEVIAHYLLDESWMAELVDD